jgi:TonB-linked SusC/RagA family outer membrane protein
MKALITYEKGFKDHEFTLLAGIEQVDFRGDWIEGFRDEYILENYEVLNAGSPVNQTATGSATEWALRSFFGRLNYNYRHKYLIEANLRYDGSSRFAKRHKYGVFPSVSAGWRISEEVFMKDIDWIDNLKIRASWGRLGNQDIGNYPFVSSVTLGLNYMFNQTPGQGGAVIDAANSDITWETTTMSNIAFDATVFSHLSVTFEYYMKNTSDILLKLPIPGTTGLNAAYQNAGEVQNKGWDFSASYNDKIEHFEYNIGINLSDVKNIITNLKGTGPYIYDRTIHKEGFSISSLYGLQAEGLVQSEEEIKNHANQFGIILVPGDIKYKDQNNDNIINAEDRVVMGSFMPRYTFGIDFYGKYKNIDLSFLLQGVGKTDGYIDQHGVFAFYMGGTAQEWHKKDHWTPENRNASYPRLTFNYPNNEQVSSFWVRNAAYLRLKNLQIGYTIPEKIVSKTFLDYCRVYLSAQNLFTVTSFYENFDPESPVGSGQFYPMMKIYSFGLNLKF